MNIMHHKIVKFISRLPRSSRSSTAASAHCHNGVSYFLQQFI